MLVNIGQLYTLQSFPRSFNATSTTVQEMMVTHTHLEYLHLLKGFYKNSGTHIHICVIVLKEIQTLINDLHYWRHASLECSSSLSSSLVHYYSWHSSWTATKFPLFFSLNNHKSNPFPIKTLKAYIFFLAVNQKFPNIKYGESWGK